MERRVGFEPTNNGVAIRSLILLGTDAWYEYDDSLSILAHTWLSRQG